MIKQRLTTPQLRRELQHALLHARVTAVRARGTVRSSADRARGTVRAVAAYAATSARALARYTAGVARAALADRSRATRTVLVVAVLVAAAVGLVLLLGGRSAGVRVAQPAPGTVIASTAEPLAPAAPQPPTAPRPTPECPLVDRTHRVAPRETLTAIALRYGAGLEQIAADSNLPDPNVITVGQLLQIRGLCRGAALITPGTTLAAYAAAHSTTVAALLALNPQITDPNRIHAGGVLRLTPGEPS